MDSFYTTTEPRTHRLVSLLLLYSFYFLFRFIGSYFDYSIAPFPHVALRANVRDSVIVSSDFSFRFFLTILFIFVLPIIFF